MNLVHLGRISFVIDREKKARSIDIFSDEKGVAPSIKMAEEMLARP